LAWVLARRSGPSGSAPVPRLDCWTWPTRMAAPTWPPQSIVTRHWPATCSPSPSRTCRSARPRHYGMHGKCTNRSGKRGWGRRRLPAARWAAVFLAASPGDCSGQLRHGHHGRDRRRATRGWQVRPAALGAALVDV